MKLLFSRLRWVVFAWLLSAVLLRSATPTWAAPLAPATDTIRPQPPTRADTAAALRRLFAQQRRASRGRILPTAASALTLNFLLAFGESKTTLQRVSTGVLIGAQGFNAYTLGRVLVRQRRYRPAREQRLLVGLAAGQPLPPRLRRQLAPEFLSPPPTP